MISKEGEKAMKQVLKKMKKKYGDNFRIIGVNGIPLDEYLKENDKDKGEIQN